MTAETLGLARFHDYEPTTEDFGAALIAGLARPQKDIPCKFFYDSVGSALFERICELPEYYPTRPETALLESHRDEITAELGDHRPLVELGSGSAVKTQLLIEALLARQQSLLFAPVDISPTALEESAPGPLGTNFVHWFHINPA